MRLDVTIRLLIAATLFAVLPAFAAAPTVKDAEAFVAGAETRLLQAWIDNERAAWVQENFITGDTEKIAAKAYEALIGLTAELAQQAVRFDGLELPEDVARKLHLLKVSLPLAAPSKAELQAEIADITTRMSSLYGTGKWCPDGADCMTLGDMSKVIADNRDPQRLLELWNGWRTVSPPIEPLYSRFVELGNAGAREMGFDDLGAMWRSGYDMDPDDFAQEVDRLWGQVRPLYEALHCHVRASLAERYGEDVVPLDGPIPAHLLGNMWAQDWSYIYDIVMPPSEAGPGIDVTSILRDRGIDELEMVRFGERFFSSLGFEELPGTFWDRSLFLKPQDREVQCHASAWDIDWVDDIRIKMCIEINYEDFVTVHHELGHNYYQRAYNVQPPLYRNSANDGFHEGLGDTLALSITPEYLVRVGLLDEAPADAGDLGLLMRSALEKIAFLPFGVVVDQWRWKVFSGEVAPDSYNAAWWALRQSYQGVAAPVARTEADFDPGAKYHVPANTPYTRYFLAHILQFQFHRALCEVAGADGPLHRCSIYGSEAVGEKLQAMMEMGVSRPWFDALEVLTGQREMDASALVEYFAPLMEWLQDRNADRTCGW